MLYIFSILSKDYIYVTCISFLLCFVLTKIIIVMLKKHKKFQPIRIEGPETHQAKAKTPTMGGCAISLSIIVPIILFCDIKKYYILIILILITSFSFIGLLDDIIKVFFNNTKGFQGSKKLFLQLTITTICMLYLCYSNQDYIDFGIKLPILNKSIPFLYLTPMIYTLIICGSSNASNITDGLDGLLSIPIILISISIILIINFSLNNIKFTNIYISNQMLNDLCIILFAIIGAFSAFMFYNKYPAKIFMGDVGSLMIGATLCYIAILLKIEMIYAIMALLFIIEIFSSILQVCYFRLTNGKRLFKMAPFHHHLEKSGWSEVKVTITLWTFSLICCIGGLILFYLSKI